MTSKLVDHTQNPNMAHLKQFRFEFESLDFEQFESSDSDEQPVDEDSDFYS